MIDTLFRFHRLDFTFAFYCFRKIPRVVKNRREYDHDDHSLNLVDLPVAQKKMNALKQDDSFGEGAA